jgi:hypothetical protein
MDATPGDDQAAGTSASPGQPPSYQPSATAQQTYSSNPGHASSYTTYQADSMAQSYAVYDAGMDQASEGKSAHGATAQQVVDPATFADSQSSGHPAPALTQAPIPDLPVDSSAFSEAGKRAAAAVLAHLRRAPELAGAWSVLPDLLEGARDPFSDGVDEGQPGAPVSPADGESSHPAPQRGNLFAGAAPIDLPTFDRAVDAFFARVEALADDMVGAPAPLRLSQWLVAAAAAAGSFEFARRWVKSSGPGGPVCDEAGEDPSWDSSPGLAVFLAEDEL